MALLLVTFGESLAMNQQQYEYEVMRENYVFMQQPKIVGYWWISGSPDTGVGTKIAVCGNEKTPEQIKLTEEMFGWIWEKANG